VPNGAGGMVSLPYVLFTTDEYASATIWDNSSVLQPSHAIGFRVVDNSYSGVFSNGTANCFGGGKLGMYSFWERCGTYPNTLAQIQFEFYDYYTDYYRELGNDAFQSGNWNAATAGAYLNAYNNIMAGELYGINPQFLTAYNSGFTAYHQFTNSACSGYQTYPPNQIPPG